MKKRIVKRMLSALSLLLICAFAFAACGGPQEDGGNTYEPPVVAAKYEFDKSSPADIRVDISLNGAPVLSIEEGGNTLAGGTDYTYADNVIVLDESYFSDKAVGSELTFTVTTAGGSTAFQVTVKQSQTPPIDVSEPEKPVIVQTEYSFDLYKPQDITVIVDLKGEELQSVKCGGLALTSGEDYTFADGKLVLKQSYFGGAEKGEVLSFTVATAGGSADFTVQIQDSVPAPLIRLSSSHISITVGEEATKITATVEYSEKDVMWRSMNTSVATVAASNEDPNVGLITAVAAGTTEVMATIGNVYATVLVSVSPAKPTIRPSIRLSSTYLQLTVGEEATEITATVENSEEDVTWRSMNSNVATVEASDEDPNVGLITAVAAGSTSVRATIGNVYATVLVSVSREITADYSEDITIDADLSDWTEAELTKTISINGDEGDTYEAGDYKSATFYGVLDKNGLYLAVDVYHGIYQSKESTWWHNSLFEIFMGTGGALHYFVYADGDDTTFTGSAAQTACLTGRDGGTTEMQVSWKTEKATDPQPTGTYHTIVEVFVPMGEISSYIGDAYLRVGVAWKSKDDGSGTDFDTCGNGEAAGGEPDNFWVPAGAWMDNADMPYVTEDGIYLRSDYNSLS